MRARLLFLFAVAIVASLGVTYATTPQSVPGGSAPSVLPARTVLITGANRGLGLEFAKQYSEAGWSVIGTARDPEKATALRQTGATVHALDVTDANSVDALVRALNGQSIDLLINNAGIGSRTPTLAELDPSVVEHVLAVNLIGPMRVTTALLPNLRTGTGKTIVSISSNLGSIDLNTAGRYHGYRESKAGLNMFMRSLAMELREAGFTCVALSPGWVRTDMGGPDATLSPKESITGMRSVIDTLTPEKSGRFFGYDGTELPW